MPLRRGMNQHFSESDRKYMVNWGDEIIWKMLKYNSKEYLWEAIKTTMLEIELAVVKKK